MRGGETVIFDGKTLSQLLDDIYSVSREKRKDIKEMIIELSKFVTKSDDAVLIVPIIKDLLEVSVKNDDQLTKMAQIVQRMVAADIVKENGSNDPVGLLTEDEKEKIIKNAREEIGSLKVTGQEIEDRIESVASTMGS